MSMPPSLRPSPGPNGCRSLPKPVLVASGCAAASSMLVMRSALSRVGEDHPAGHGLENARDGDVELGVDGLRAALDDDHRPVVEVADPLPGVLARLDDLVPQVLAREQRGLDRIRQ